MLYITRLSFIRSFENSDKTIKPQNCISFLFRDLHLKIKEANFLLYLTLSVGCSYCLQTACSVHCDNLDGCFLFFLHLYFTNKKMGFVHRKLLALKKKPNYLLLKYDRKCSHALKHKLHHWTKPFLVVKMRAYWKCITFIAIESFRLLAAYIVIFLLVFHSFSHSLTLSLFALRTYNIEFYHV